ncbi:hypothetical protein AAG906_009534 [Vitis piasezkii]
MAGSSSMPSLPPPCPKSPPDYPDLYGKRRGAAKVQMLEREIGFLEEELKSIEGLQHASRCCKEVVDFVVANSDPIIPTNSKSRKSCRFWKWLCGWSCFNFSWICCCPRCSLHLEMPDCCDCNCNPCNCCDCNCNPCNCCDCNLCNCCDCNLCNCCSCFSRCCSSIGRSCFSCCSSISRSCFSCSCLSCPCFSRKCFSCSCFSSSCFSCLRPKWRCCRCSQPKCRCCSWPRFNCFNCFKKMSCSRHCCILQCPSCPDCSCSCWRCCSCPKCTPKCPKVRLCPSCKKPSCNPFCLCY